MIGHDLAPLPLDGVLEYLGFLLDGEGYAIPIEGIAEIMKPLPIAPVPRARREILGVMSVRGRLATVVSLRACLGLGPRRVDARTRILLVETAHEDLGFLVDEVTGVFHVDASEVEPPAVLGADFGAHVRGAARPDGELVVLLDVTSLLPARAGEH